jgi:hypothetical protein
VLGVARKLGVHRRMVRKALASAEPPERWRWQPERPLIGPRQALIDAVLKTGPSGSAQTRPHGASHLAADYDGAGGIESGGSDGATVGARAQTGAGLMTQNPLKPAMRK